MAEIELCVLARQAFSKPLPDMAAFINQVYTWNAERNTLCPKIPCQFTTAGARIKLAKLYPALL